MHPGTKSLDGWGHTAPTPAASWGPLCISQGSYTHSWLCRSSTLPGAAHIALKWTCQVHEVSLCPSCHNSRKIGLSLKSWGFSAFQIIFTKTGV